MNQPNFIGATPGSRNNASGSSRPEGQGTRPASGPANALLQAANLAYAELMKQEDEEKRKREASETLVGLQWRYA